MLLLMTRGLFRLVTHLLSSSSSLTFKLKGGVSQRVNYTDHCDVIMIINTAPECLADVFTCTFLDM